jgi:hypothetical protein
MRARPPAALEHDAVPWLLVVALATAGPHAEHLPAWLTLLVAAALLWRTWLWHQQRRMPPRWSLALLVIAAVAAIGWQFGSLFGKDAGVAMLVLFMALKPLEMHSRRDALVVIMLGYFLLLTHYFYSQSIPTGLWLLAACTLLTGALLRLHGGAQPVIAIARQAGLLLLQALPFMLLLYLLFPRVTGPLWGLPQDAHAGLSGLPSQMSPGSISNLTLSGAIAFRSRFAGEIPEQADLYWRGPVFDEYDGVTWRASRQHGRSPAPAPVIEARGPAHDYSSILEAHNQRWLLALDVPTRLPPDSSLAATLEAQAREPLRIRSRFSFSSVLDYRANRMEAPASLQQALTLPPQGQSAHARPRQRVAVATTSKDRRGGSGDVSPGRLPLHPAPTAARCGRHRRIPVRQSAWLLRALRFGLRLPDACGRRAGARGCRLPGRRAESG